MAIRKQNTFSTNKYNHLRRRNAPKSGGNLSLYQILLPNSNLRGFARKFWLICCFSSAIVCVLQLQDRITFYFTTPIMTQVNITQADAGQFPPVTVCPVYFKAEFPKVLEYILDNRCAESDDCKNFTSGNLDRLLHYPLKKMNFSVDDVWKHGSIDDQKVLIYASCAGIVDKTICTLGKDLTLSLFTRDTLQGKCNTYTLENDVEYNGASTFWKFLVLDHSFTSLPEEYDEIADIFYFIPYTMSTLSMQAYYSGKNLLKNQRNDIVISSKKFVFLNLKNRPCKDEETVVQCHNKCFTNKLETNLNCRLPFFNSTTLKPCLTGASIDEAYREGHKVYLYTRSNECKCPQMCTEVVYDSVLDVLPNPVDNLNTTTFTFYFADDNIEIVTEALMYTFPALLSDIAGNVGFFLGLSVLRALHIFVNLFTYFTNVCKGKSPVYK